MTSPPFNVLALLERVLYETRRPGYRGHVQIGDYDIGSGAAGHIGFTKRNPPTRGQIFVLRIKDEWVESWASQNHIEEALTVLRAHQVLDDLADV